MTWIFCQSLLICLLTWFCELKALFKMAKIIILLIFLVAFQLSSVVSFTGISFCEEKYFDNMFQDKQFIYLNVFDAQHSENRLYRWVYGSSQIDQFVTANVDSREWNCASYKGFKMCSLFSNFCHLQNFSFPRVAFTCLATMPPWELTTNQRRVSTNTPLSAFAMAQRCDSPTTLLTLFRCIHSATAAT